MLGRSERRPLLRTIATEVDVRGIGDDFRAILKRRGIMIPSILTKDLIEVELVGRLLPTLQIEVRGVGEMRARRVESPDFEDIVAECALVLLRYRYSLNPEFLRVLATSIVSVLKRSGVEVVTPPAMRLDASPQEMHDYWMRFAETHGIPAA